MKLLLDTHIFIWLDSEPNKLSPHIRALCTNSTNLLLLSVVSIWEMQIKAQLGKLNLALPLQQIVMEQQMTNGIQVIPIELAHVLALDGLPTPHKDPFDRLLIAQAIVEGATILTADRIFASYPVPVLH